MLTQSTTLSDSTSLLIVKDEINNIIKQIEVCTQQLIEDDVLAFGFDDALANLDQAAKVLQLIEHPYLSQLTALIAAIARKILADYENAVLQIDDAKLMNEGMSVLLSYIDFFCIQECSALQLLIPTINRLEIALQRPITREGRLIENFLPAHPLQEVLEAPDQLQLSAWTLQLYKQTLLKLLQNKMSQTDYHALALSGQQFASQAEGHPSQQFWRLVAKVFKHAEQVYLTEPRLRIFIGIESLAQQLYQQPDQLEIGVDDWADLITIGLAQDNQIAQQLRQQLQLATDQLPDQQIQKIHQQLFGLNLETIQAVCQLLNELINTITQHIEWGNYRQEHAIQMQMSADLNTLSNVFAILNLTEVSDELKQQSLHSQHAGYFDDLRHTEALMECLGYASNSLQILEYQFSPLRSKMALNNPHIHLDTVEDAQKTLCQETRQRIHSLTQHVERYIETQQLQELETFPASLKEISGALHFLESETGYQMLNHMAELIEQAILHSQRHLDTNELSLLANCIASVDSHVERILYHQPCLPRSLEIGYASFKELQRAVI